MTNLAVFEDSTIQEFLRQIAPVRSELDRLMLFPRPGRLKAQFRLRYSRGNAGKRPAGYRRSLRRNLLLSCAMSFTKEFGLDKACC